jgi:signal recognition particle subunit SEC65
MAFLKRETNVLECAGIDANNNNDKGYPKVFKNPMWFIVHQDLMKVILKVLIGEKNSKKEVLLKTLETEINSSQAFFT